MFWRSKHNLQHLVHRIESLERRLERQNEEIHQLKCHRDLLLRHLDLQIEEVYAVPAYERIVKHDWHFPGSPLNEEPR